MTEYPPMDYDPETDTGRVRGFFSIKLDHDCDQYNRCLGVDGPFISFERHSQRASCVLCLGAGIPLTYSDRLDNDELGLCQSCIGRLRNTRYQTPAALFSYRPGTRDPCSGDYL